MFGKVILNNVPIKGGSVDCWEYFTALVRLCPSLSTMLEVFHWCAVVSSGLMVIYGCRCLMCSLNLFPMDLADSPMYSPSHSSLLYLYQYITPLYCLMLYLSLGVTRMFFKVLPLLEGICMPFFYISFWYFHIVLECMGWPCSPWSCLTSKHKFKFINILRKIKAEGGIDDNTYMEMFPTGPSSPNLYGLLRNPQKEHPLRPILSSKGTVTYHIAKELSTILKSLLKQSIHHVNNTQEFVEHITNIKLGAEVFHMMIQHLSHLYQWNL